MNHYIRFWGDFGLFTNPLHPAERQTYPIPTHSALRNMIGSIVWKPELHQNGGCGWSITRCAIKNPITTMSLTRNEVKNFIVKSKGCINPIHTSEMRINGVTPGIRTQRNTILLTNLDYVVEFHLDFPNNFERTDGNIGAHNYIEKYIEMFYKRATVGACYHQPFLGCKEFNANFELSAKEEMVGISTINMKIPTMLYERVDLYDISKVNRSFANIEIKNGIVEYPTWRQLNPQ